MFAIQMEDIINDKVSVLPEIAGNTATAVHLMMEKADQWIGENVPTGLTIEVHHRATAIDLCIGDEIVATLSAHVISGVVIHTPSSIH